jgi:hypothetical protein
MMSEETRLYRWQWSFSENDEIGTEEARSLHQFVRAHLVDGKVEHAETVKPPDRIELVVYYDQLPSDALVQRHQQGYGKTPMTVSLPARREGEHTITEICEYDISGRMTGRVRSLIDENELPLREWRHDANGSLYEIVEYEYDANGDVGVVRSLTPDGTLIHEDRPPLSD